jgi:hypothetical protein
VEGSCEHCNKLSGFTTFGKSLSIRTSGDFSRRTRLREWWIVNNSKKKIRFNEESILDCLLPELIASLLLWYS